MSASNRAFFLDGLRNNPLTIAEIVEAFDCNVNTARQWVKHEEVERVLGSYPPAYVRKDTLIMSSVVGPAKPKENKIVIEFDKPQQEEVEAFFNKIMEGRGGNIDFMNEFRSVDSQKSLSTLMSKLKSAIIVCDYYKGLMERDGMK